MKRALIHFLMFISTLIFCYKNYKVEAQNSVTFFVISDTHCDPVLQYDELAMSRAVNAVANSGSWPSSIGGVATGFTVGPIGAPSGVVFTGDLMGWGNSPQEIPTFRHYYETGNSGESINFPSYIGLGNHDLDDTPDRTGAIADNYRQQAWNYVDGRHKGAGAPVPVTAFDAVTHAYSWDIAGVHFVQMHRNPGDVNWGLTSNLDFLRNDLSARASDGRPVFIFHHYGMDAFGTEDRWWTKPQRDAYRDVIKPYNIAGIFAGHSHAAMQYVWESQRVFQVNNAKAENGTGNNDGNGSFAIVRITGQKLEVMTCRWLDDQGHFELIAPFYGGTISNPVPTVSITAPGNNAIYTAPASITISANASDADGTISKVEFYNGTTLLNTDVTSPYSYNWTNVAAGNYSITAKATDNTGHTSTSSIVSVIVNVPQSPYGGTRASIPGTIQAENYDLGGQNVAFNDVTAANEGGVYRTDAVDIEPTTPSGYNVGYVQPGEWLKYMVNVTTAGKYKIEAYVAATAAGKSFTLDLDGTIIGTVNVPNTGGWQTWQAVTIDNVSLTAGNKILRFNATTGDFNLDKVVFTLYPNVAPTVSITAPSNNVTFTAPASVTINATANDTDGSISKVEFYNGTTLLNSDNATPFSYNWTGVTAGTYTITAKAYDNFNLSTTSTTITIVVNNPNVAPTVSITAPANNATYIAPASVTINATANDTDGSISKVEFYNGTTLLNSDNATPFSYNWTGVAAGTYAITAKAYDNINLSTTSTTITIVVNNPNVAPTVSITAPSNNATFTAPASVTINATANDTDGLISKVEFYNGTTLLNSDNATPFSYNWTGVAAGTYTITAKAYDNFNLSTTSTAITIVVNNPNVAPTVSITAPANNATYIAPASVTINATANDTDGSISKVEYYNGSTLLGAISVSPYSYNWTGVIAGTYTITAKAYDNLNLNTTSTPITIVVNNPNQNPTISITSPANNATFTAPASVTISADASDPDGTISKVEFYNETSLLSSDVTLPYSFNWTGVTVGTYAITAKAYDNTTGTATSSILTIIVNNVSGTENCSNVLPWKSSSIYVKDDLVTYNNLKYKAKWWTTGEDPSLKSGQWDVWIKLGECISGTAPSTVPTLTMTPNNGSSINISESINMNVIGISSGSVIEVKYFIYKGTDLVSLITKDGVDLNANWNASEIGDYLLQVVAKDSEGNYVFSDAQPIEVLRPTSITDDISTNTIMVFPNPTTETIYLNETISTVNIFDLSGNVLDIIQLNGNKQISLSKYSSGVYLIQLISKDQSQYIKVTKE